MNEQNFDTFVRHAAAAVSRRTSLQTLGAAALVAGLAAPATTEAAQNKAKKKAKKKCKKSSNQCRLIVLAADPTPDPEILACCNSCFTGAFLACLVAAQMSMESLAP